MLHTIISLSRQFLEILQPMNLTYHFCPNTDNAMYEQPDIRGGVPMDATLASTYEVPVDTVRRTNDSHQQQGAEGPAAYSTVQGGFLDSFESEYDVTSHVNALSPQNFPVSGFVFSLP